MAGCCGAGVFAGVEMLQEGVVVGVLDGTDASFGVGGPVSTSAREAGRAAVAEALAALGNRARFIVLSDALTGDAASVIRGALQEAGAGAGWVGGRAGDNLRFVRTAQFARSKAMHDSVVVVAIESDRPTSVGIRHGWHPYGPPTMVTRAHGATAVELDFQRAFDAYREVARNNGDDVTERELARFATPRLQGPVEGRHPRRLARPPRLQREARCPRSTAPIPHAPLPRRARRSAEHGECPSWET